VRFSIVIPTQDRAKLLSAAVEHAMRLEHPDFEVIVSDNSTTPEWQQRNREAVREYIDAPNFRLVRPPRVLSPPAHFEFALEHANGAYVTYLTDKMVVFPHALSDVEAVLGGSEADIVNWACAEYFLDEPGSPLGSGTLVEELEFLNGQPEDYDPLAVLRRKASGAVPREQQTRHDYVLGKIVFGCYSRALIDRIRSKSGTVFGGATHDYSAMVQALSLARRCVMLNAYEAIFFSLPRAQSLGSATATEPQRALEYYRAFTRPDLMLSSLLVPGVYASQHNMVARDYKTFLPVYGNGRLFNERNWLRAVCADLLSESLIWRDPAEKAAQVGLFRRHVNRGYLFQFELRRRLAGVRSRAIRMLGRHPAVTSRAFAAASLEQAMEHVLHQGREESTEGDRPPGLLDAPMKVGLSLALTLRTPQLRPLLGRCLGDAIVHPATARSLPSVLEDLLKLAIVHRIRGAKGGPPDVAVTVERSPAEVVLRSLPAQDVVAAESRNGDVSALRRVTWDHSAIGGDIRWPLPIGGDVRIVIGEPDRHVHEFRSLPALAARFPAQTARALP
jgi:glycosyltransferase involved in cell wall biosynthesis